MPIEDQIPTIDEDRTQFEKDTDVSLEMGNAAHNSLNTNDPNEFDRRGSEASRRIFNDNPLGSSEITETGTNRIVISEKGKKLGKNALAGLGIAAGLAIAGPAMVDAANGPEFSEETTTITVEDGDGMQRIVERAGLAGSDWRDASSHIANLPENQDVFKDGLQTGETVSVPVSFDK